MTDEPTMRFSIEKDALQRLATAAAKGTPANPRMPILGAVLFDLVVTEAALGTPEAVLTVSVTDYETFLTIRSGDASGDSVGGTVAIPAKAFEALLKGLPAGKVTAETVSEQRVRVKGGRNHFRLVMMPVSEFPAAPEVVGRECTVDGPLLAQAVRQVLPAVSKDEGRPVLNGVLWSAEGDVLRLASTDSYRLAVKTIGIHNGEGGSFDSIIPGRTLERLPEADGTCAITLADNQARLAVGDSTIVTRLIEGKFPDYQQLIPSEYPNRLTAKTQALAEALEAVIALLRANTPAVLHLGEEVRVTGTETSIGDVEQFVDATYEGDPFKIGVNARFLVEALRVLDGEEVAVDLIDPGRPMRIMSPADESYMHLLMPVRLT
jgi:DNA polymerase-3 subunit beta